MSEQKPIEKTIPKLFLHNALDNQFFGYCLAVRSHFPGISMEKTIDMFYKTMHITEEDWGNESARSTYYRMSEQFFKYLKDEKN